MPQLVVTCHANGSVETLLKDNVFDTRKLADTRKIERLSEVLPTDDGRSFYIRWLKGPLAGQLGATCANIDDMYYSHWDIMCWPNDETMYFSTYEIAVQAEIETVNALRLKGYSFT